MSNKLSKKEFILLSFCDIIFFMSRKIRIKRKASAETQQYNKTNKKKIKPLAIIGVALVLVACAAVVGYKFLFAKPDVDKTLSRSATNGYMVAFGIDENIYNTLNTLSFLGIYEGIDELKYKAFGGKENYDSLVESLRQAGYDVSGVSSVDITASNASSSALYGSVVLFHANVRYTDSAKTAHSAALDSVSIDSYDGFTPVRSNALFVTGDPSATCSVSFGSVSETFSYTVAFQSTSFDNIDILVNKISRIDSSYSPTDLTESGAVSHVYPTGDEVNQMRDEATQALSEMFAAAASDGIELYALSGYRSYGTQVYLYERAGGDSQNNTAAPGASEHQTGLCMDITWSAAGMGLSSDMQYDAEYEWLINNSYKYGFVLRYPDGWDDITGYVYEPWHYRYIGRDYAAAYRSSGANTLEEFMSAH